MAQTKKRRNRKRRGTQGGRVDPTRRAGRPRTREEAKAQARARRKPTQRVDRPPTWGAAAIRGLIAAVVFAVFSMLIFKNSAGVALLLGASMLVIYIPAGYYIDSMMWRRRERARIRAAQKKL